MTSDIKIKDQAGMTTLFFAHNERGSQISVASRNLMLIANITKDDAIKLRNALNDWIEEEN